jgi:hypothetical protein
MNRSAEQQVSWERATQMVVQELEREFRSSHSPETIEAVARESVAEIASENVRITTFVPVLARRVARSRLKEAEQRAS